MIRGSFCGMIALVLASGVFSIRLHAGTRGDDPNRQVTIGANGQVSKPRSQVTHREVTLAADPKHPERLLAASLTSPLPKDPDYYEVVTYLSLDDGKTWMLTQEHKRVREGEAYSDPSVVYGADGAAYLVDFGKDFHKSEGAHLDLSRSQDGGKTWAPAFVMEENSDRPFLAVDRSTGKYQGRIYCIRNVQAALLNSFSSDNGKTFQKRRWNLPGGTFGMGNPAIDSQGTLIVPYPTHAAPHQVMVGRSVDGGETLLPTVWVGTCRGCEYSGLPSLAVDTESQAYKNCLYLVWADDTGNGIHVLFARSLDQGATWSRPTLLSEQPEGPTRAYDAYLPTIATNKSGVVGVCWYDTRHVPADKQGWQIRFRASRDGGATWLPSVRVSEVDCAFGKAEKPESVFAGDTAGLCADGNGVFHALWVDNRTGVLQVWTAPITVQNPVSK
ncbi:MAG TPA: sialidase family protein [Chthonomonadaceae bacterium]|nr:sialidase family protein [Chthonomonadaceae bacterium]